MGTSEAWSPEVGEFAEQMAQELEAIAGLREHDVASAGDTYREAADHIRGRARMLAFRAGADGP